ncbi:MAG: hypothetical protein K2N74_05820, partial [Clostridiales bacterium]|nr:hypothetical protein [Clostridiales bacterium]
MEPTRERKEELFRLLQDYRDIGLFLSENAKLSYMQFDYAVVHGLPLFMLEPDFSFEDLEREIDAFLSALPSVKRIFAKPRIHLKERREILPTESVRIIDNNTIQHCLSHSELWTDIQDDMVKPAKLQTRTYVDNYGIYENLVFCQTVDGILSFVRTYMRFFKELIYTNQTIEINFLERLNHLNYFLALGKLHVGYGKNLEIYYPVSMRCMHKLQQISDNIIPLLKRPVYSKNKNRLQKVKIHKTNILSMDKDYRQIYRLAKSLSAKQPDEIKELSSNEFDELQYGYFGFCEALAVFSIGHFNFVCKENAALNFDCPNIAFRFRDWELQIEGTRGNRQTFSVTIRKDKTYKIIFIPTL